MSTVHIVGASIGALVALSGALFAVVLGPRIVSQAEAQDRRTPPIAAWRAVGGLQVAAGGALALFHILNIARPE